MKKIKGILTAIAKKFKMSWEYTNKYFNRYSKNFDLVLTSDIVGVTTSIVVILAFIPIVLISGLIAGVKSFFN